MEAPLQTSHSRVDEFQAGLVGRSMSGESEEYVYLVLPQGYVPSRERMDPFLKYYDRLGGFKLGRHGRTGAIALEFNAAELNRLRETDRAFKALVKSFLVKIYEGKKGRLQSLNVDFQQDQQALNQPAPEKRRPRRAAAVSSADSMVIRYETDDDLPPYHDDGSTRFPRGEMETSRLLGENRLKQNRFRMLVARFAEFAAWVPWILAGGGALSTIGMGIALYRTLETSDIERRSDLHRRVGNDPLNESISKPPSEEEPAEVKQVPPPVTKRALELVE